MLISYSDTVLGEMSIQVPGSGLVGWLVGGVFFELGCFFFLVIEFRSS